MEATKRCTGCGEEKILDDFYRCAEKKDGRHSQCKDCQKPVFAAYAKTPARRATKIAYAKTPAGKATKRRGAATYMKTPAGKATRRRRDAAYRLKHPEREKAKKALNHAVQAGKLTRPTTCTVNGRNCKGHIEAHHDDYSKPLDVDWLCKYHHQMIPNQE